MTETPITNTKTVPLHLVAIDLSKERLEVICAGEAKSFGLGYDEKGLRRLVEHLGQFEHPFVVCEATGGYERPLLARLHEEKIPVALLNPARLRAFALSEGIKAKTDPIDARMILRFACQKQLRPTPAPDPKAQQLADLLDRRSHLTEQLTREKTRLPMASKCTAPFIQRMIRVVEKDLKAIEALIDKVVRDDRRLNAQAQTLQSVQGVGKVTAWTLLAYFGELAHLSRNQIVALAGIAPFNRDSGNRSGRRSICGGRAKVRKCLYMAAQTAANHNPVIKPYVQGLIARGKPYKCAIVAAMRKLLIHLHSLIKIQQKALAS